MEVVVVVGLLPSGYGLTTPIPPQKKTKNNKIDPKGATQATEANPRLSYPSCKPDR